MDMSKAAAPPKGAVYSNADRSHPLFSAYMAHVTFCAQKMLDASEFRDWLFQRQQQELHATWVGHEQYPAFLAWMQETKAGGRPCLPNEALPKGLAFPHNFIAWMEGTRW